MRFAIGKWIRAVVIVEVDPDEFNGPQADALLSRLEKYFMGQIAMVTPDWEADLGFRTRGLSCPVEVATSADLVWRDLELPAEEEIPF